MGDAVKASRKACNFCYRRKIKCDGQQPLCSNCVVYNKECAYDAPSRKSQSRKRPKDHFNIDRKADSTAVRFERLETQVRELTSRLEESRRNRGPQNSLREQLLAGDVTDQNVPTNGDIQGRMSLPPLQIVLRIVHDYIENFNTILPLFHGPSLLHLVHNFYSQEIRSRSPLAWAAISVVLGLAHRYTLIGDGSPTHAIKYLSRAQSVLSTIILAETDLLTIQILLGMVMLLQGSPEHDPPLLLIGTTMRLAHKIGLHDRSFSEGLDAVTVQQRAYVFWIAYILDKDIGFRSRQPSLQLDEDIDLELPLPKACADSQDFGGSPGVLTTADGASTFNFFVSRIQLAVVQGGVYDYLYSTRARKRTPEERDNALKSVDRAIQQWKSSIPPEFSAHMAIHVVCPQALRFLADLHSSSLACVTSVNRANAWNEKWIKDLREHSANSIAPPLPRGWESVVDDARGLMSLFRALPVLDRSNFWTTGCSYITAMMLLTANITYSPHEMYFHSDSELVAGGLSALDDMIVADSQSAHLQKFRDICAEVNQKAQLRYRTTSMVQSYSHDLPSELLMPH